MFEIKDPKMFAIYMRMKSLEVEFEGMKVMNEERRSQGYALAYSEEAFADMSNDIDKLVKKLEEHLDSLNKTVDITHSA